MRTDKAIEVGLEREEHVRRFWSKVAVGDARECWPWTATICSHGYGVFFMAMPGRPKGIKVRAHRFALACYSGAVERDLLAIHSCDNRPCCNPTHLRFGTVKDNSADCMARGRAKFFHTPGEINGMARISVEQVRAIRALAGTTTIAAIARAFGLSHTHTTSIIARERWKHVV